MGLFDNTIKEIENAVRANGPPPKETYPALWFVWIPGEDAPQMHRTAESASAQADLVARMYVGTKAHIYQLKSVGSISYPNTPVVLGDVKR